jgi:hypothetical protein
MTDVRILGKTASQINKSFKDLLTDQLKTISESD